jgi:hypothetical protein
VKDVNDVVEKSATEALERAINTLIDICSELEDAAEDLFEAGDVDFSNGLHALSIGIKTKINKRYPDAPPEEVES